MRAEKYNLIQELGKKNRELVGRKRLSMVGQGDFPGANNVTRAAMNVKHHVQHLAIDDPEFPMLYDGKENIAGEFSSYHRSVNKRYTVFAIAKEYDKRLGGHSKYGLIFLHCPDDDSYTVVARKEVESLTENFGFEYNNEFLDQLQVGELIPAGSRLFASRSYDEFGNVGTGVNARMLFAAHPAVQDDAIIISESFAKRMVANNVVTRMIPIGENTILLNLYGKKGKYQGLPNIGDRVTNGILCATREVKEQRIFSDMREPALSIINFESDRVYYANGEVTNITVYRSNQKLKKNVVTAQLLEYFYDGGWFWTDVYEACKKIINSGSKSIDPEIHRWMRRAMNYLDTEAKWAFNDTESPNLMVAIEIRSKECLSVGRKITGRSGNKTVISQIWPDNEMPYTVEDIEFDQYNVAHPVGKKVPIDAITNELAIINRTIPMAMFESSVTFIIDKTRKHAARMRSYDEKAEFILDVISLLNPREGQEVRDLYMKMNPKEKKQFVDECISLNPDGSLRTDDGIYIRWDAFSKDHMLRDAIITCYEKYPDVFKPYEVFMPKPAWGRDIRLCSEKNNPETGVKENEAIGYIGYQYIMMLKQSGEKGFIVRAGGAISDEGLPEKTNSKKIGTSWASQKPIRFGEYDTPGFHVITDPWDFALVTALYRSSLDGRKYLCEAVMSGDGLYNLPDYFVSRTVQVLQVYFKSLGCGMECIDENAETIGFPEDATTMIAYELQDYTVMCTVEEMHQLKRIHRVYRRFLKENPSVVSDVDETWDYIIEHLPFKKKELLPNIPKIFKEAIEYFGRTKEGD